MALKIGCGNEFKSLLKVGGENKMSFNLKLWKLHRLGAHIKSKLACTPFCAKKSSQRMGGWVDGGK